ncbi:MAG: DUF167 domain-containing protein [Promethearchaeota archaeon]
MKFFRIAGGTPSLSVAVVPNARKFSVSPALEDEEFLQVHLDAAPRKGKANKALASKLGEFFGIPRGEVQILRGATSRTKLVGFPTLSRETIEATLLERGVLQKR